jgi:hypothetical protein
MKVRENKEVFGHNFVCQTFMTLSPGGRMHPGREHEAEKSD